MTASTLEHATDRLKENKEGSSTQYDDIGGKYGEIKVLEATELENPSLMRLLGDVKGLKCLDLACGLGHYTHILSTLGASSVHGYDISPSMISGALSTYPPTAHPTIHFAVADCSDPSSIPPPPTPAYDLVFAAWFLNYAATEKQLTDMFRVVEQNLNAKGRFVGLTTNVDDPWVKEDKKDFYGLDVVVLEKEYVAPDTREEVGIKARVCVGGEGAKDGFSFDVFQFRREVYERCASGAGLWIRWGRCIVPEEDERPEGFWERFLERPTFSVFEAGRLGG